MLNKGYAKSFPFGAMLIIITISLVTTPGPVINYAAAISNEVPDILVEPDENSKYLIEWEWDSTSNTWIGFLQPKIKVADESRHKIVGYVSDSNGTRLTMYNDEQVVIVRYNLTDGTDSEWEVADRLYKGYFAISIPPQLIGKVESVRIYINNHMYAVNDETESVKQSLVFANSAHITHKLGSLIHLNGLSLGFEKILPNLAFPIVNDPDLMGNDKYVVRSIDNASPIFLTRPSNVTIKLNQGYPIVLYDLPIASDIGAGQPSVICNPSPGSNFSFGKNVVKCTASYESGHAAYSNFVINVPEYLDIISESDLMPVQIDIVPFYPGSNTVELKYTTVVNVAIFGNSSLNVREIGLDSLQFGPESARLISSFDWYRTDVNADGHVDLVSKFDVLEAGLHRGYDGNACVKGIIRDGEAAFQGCDNIRVLAK